MSVGHHISDRGHVQERSRNYHTGQEEHNEEFINLEEEQSEAFEQEWQRRLYPHLALTGPPSRAPAVRPSPLALPAPPQVSPAPQAIAASSGSGGSAAKRKRFKKEKKPYAKV